MRVDVEIKGPFGNNVDVRDGVLYAEGSNHWLEWAHHLLPFAGFREAQWARRIADYVEAHPGIHTIAGHSLGGTVVAMAGSMLWKRGKTIYIYTYGAKRPTLKHRPIPQLGKHYCIKGDVVPKLPPWRWELPLIVLDYGDVGMVEAHEPRMYKWQMRKDGVR